MIQRIQTIYLFLAFLSSLLLIFVPMGSVIDIDSATAVSVSLKQLHWALILNIISCVVALGSIFLFRNYALQRNAIRLNLALGIVIIALLAYYLLIEPTTKLSSPGVGLPLPIFALIFNFLAMKGVKHDQNIMKSYDRLR